MGEAERRAAGSDPLPNLEIDGLSQFQGGQVIRLDLENCHVGLFVGTDQLCLELKLIVEDYAYLKFECETLPMLGEEEDFGTLLP
ncbi:hypothetical protein SAMN04488129_11323 [Halomonas daqiaonensis]|uniref:Uncharacterized protein n=1 Tax=Halomonas daqiaonensis TaxID=650850 RepID=A0A1H7RS31_9GAMM|nr:hypothetical protein SAMN04488129_11323 [Halomonas daqiaonensis]